MKTSHEKNCYNTKIVQTKSHVEIWHYNTPIRVGRKRDLSGSGKAREKRGYEKVNAIVRRRNYYKNKREEVRRIVDLNFDGQTSFLTLTQDPKEPSCRDVKLSNHNFDKFVRRLKYYLKKSHPEKPLKYLATWERTKAGVVHYHVILFSFPFVPAKKLEEIWGHGFVKVNKIRGIDAKKRGAYVSKYFTKDIDLRERKSKAYFKSRNLKVPEARKFLLPEGAFDPGMFGKPSYSSSYRLVSGQDFPVEVSYYMV